MTRPVNRASDTTFSIHSQYLTSCNQHRLLPPLNPGTLPPAYFTLGESRHDGHSSMRDPDIEQAEKASSSIVVPEPPIPPPELTKSGKPLTKKQKKEVGTYTILYYERHIDHPGYSTAQEQNGRTRLV